MLQLVFTTKFIYDIDFMLYAYNILLKYHYFFRARGIFYLETNSATPYGIRSIISWKTQTAKQYNNYINRINIIIKTIFFVLHIYSYLYRT